MSDTEFPLPPNRRDTFMVTPGTLTDPLLDISRNGRLSFARHRRIDSLKRGGFAAAVATGEHHDPAVFRDQNLC